MSALHESRGKIQSKNHFDGEKAQGRNLNENWHFSTILRRVCSVLQHHSRPAQPRAVPLLCAHAHICFVYLSRHNLSLVLNRFIGIELHGEESVAFSGFIRYMATSRHTYTHILQCSPASVGLAQAHPNQNRRVSTTVDTVIRFFSSSKILSKFRVK